MDEKGKAVHYIKEHRIDVILQQTLNDLYRKHPGNVFGYLAEELDKHATKPSIKTISGYGVKSVHDDINRVTIEATCLVHNHEEISDSATCGFNSTEDTMNLDELKAINDALHGLPALEQEPVDTKLKSLDVSSGMKLSVSSAILKSSARLQKLSMLDLIQQQYSGKGLKMPTPIVSLLNSGKSGPGKNNMSSLAVCPKLGLSYEKSMKILESIYKAVEEMLKKKQQPCVSPNGAFNVSCDKPEQMIELVKEAITELEIVPGSDFFFVLDVLASDFHSEVVPGQGSAKKGQSQSNSRHRYDWFEGQLKPTEDFCDFLEGLVESEDIIGLVDPFHHEDVEGYEMLAKKISSKCLLFSREATPHSSNVFRLNTTITHSVAQLQELDRPATVLEAAVYEEGETMIADLALVSGVGFVMFGGFRGIRGKLYNQVSKLLQQKGPTQNVLSSWGFKDVVPEEDSPEQEQ
ncbi:enolase 4-like isoform X2 [Bolinopsis microptera]|uniref:enolase 4-like isoform X2 n=1 Tax=Bolinopsis microptera TaxID=2820187 RepID=UPI00307A01DC